MGRRLILGFYTALTFLVILLEAVHALGYGLDLQYVQWWYQSLDGPGRPGSASCPGSAAS